MIGFETDGIIKKSFSAEHLFSPEFYNDIITVWNSKYIKYCKLGIMNGLNDSFASTLQRTTRNAEICA